MNFLDIAEDNTNIYSHDENPKKKIPYKIVDYTLNKKKLKKKIKN
jgi:hypothetical protein